MNLLYLVLLIFNTHLVISFGLYGYKTNWKRLVTKFNESSNRPVTLKSASEKWIQQPLDHNDVNETRTWNMRFFEDTSNWKAGGPVILVIGGEESACAMKYGLSYELAQEVQGAIFSSEHRYYGKSNPFKDYTTANLKYLHSFQAIHDNANLLRLIKSNPAYSKSKVVVVGCSYPGNLAAWFKVLFPKLIDAAIASSAPVLVKEDFYEYLEFMGEAFKKYGSNSCYDALSNSFSRINELLKSNKGIEQLKKECNICDNVDLTISINKMHLINSFLSDLKVIVQYGSIEDIQKYCSNLVSHQCLALSINFNNYPCVDLNFDNYIEYIKSIMAEGEDTFVFNYQLCNEFGYFHTCDSKQQPFTDIVTKEYFLETCKRLFGPEFDEERVSKGVQETNKLYGGSHPNVKNVVFVNGDLDPYSTLSITKNLSNDVPAVVIPNASHCTDYSDNPSGEMREYWEQIKTIVKQWINA